MEPSEKQAGAQQEAVDTTETSVTKRARLEVLDSKTAKQSPSVNDYVPRSMSIEEFSKLSRNQRKKVMNQENWERQAAAFKEKKQEQRRERRRRHNQRIARGEIKPSRPPPNQIRTGHQIVVDMDFDDKMSEREIKSMCTQLSRCYSVNRCAEKHVDLHITKLHEKSSSRFEALGSVHTMWAKQYIDFHDKEYLDLFDKEKLVYLTADSPNVIEHLDPEKAYLVGGIVDRNRYKLLTLKKAEEQGIAHAQLPIGQYIHMASRKVMTVNQIFEILLRFIETGDWKSAFVDVIPQRKFKDNAPGNAESIDDDNAQGSSDTSNED
ncbi:tRNA (guanine(9)-N(1))-methyltransferase [Coemansia guatemalensis]|uniref:tRNA (guanine(9)-N1)-methyltransferase n=1 Tax=Coemansia guatemalensis TaxID=2761395 RepID=A0A9W8LWJ4_9FUNG|nr:tRNA (guanine(9)-N(1))-methyltransferase [Coemansia guatemalensis]